MKTLVFLFAVLILAACAATAPPSAPATVTHPMIAVSSADAATGATPASAVAAASPSAAFLRQARLAGYHIKNLRKGTTVFCKNETPVGSRFATESCINEVQLEEFLIRVQDQRDKLDNRRGTGTYIHKAGGSPPAPTHLPHTGSESLLHKTTFTE